VAAAVGMLLWFLLTRLLFLSVQLQFRPMVVTELTLSLAMPEVAAVAAVDALSLSPPLTNRPG
jgi:hypothetical protein